MAKTIIGSFMFRDEGDGCLTSKYLEHNCERTYTECCKIIAPVDGIPFIGIYQTTWIEEPNIFRTAQLEITKLATEEFYLLKWTNISDSNMEYEGKAFLSEGKLIGSYWDIK